MRAVVVVVVPLSFASLIALGCSSGTNQGAETTASDTDAQSSGADTTGTTDTGVEITGTGDTGGDTTGDTGGDTTADTGDATTGDGTDTGRPPVEEQYTTFVGDWTMKPGKETTKCVLKRLTNPTEVWVTAIHTKLAKGSHHLVVYRSTSEEEKPEPFGCTPFTETLSGDTIPLIISQVPEETLELPDGVAFKFQPNQMIRVEAHYLNYYDEDIVAHGDVTFDTINLDDVDAEADMLFYGTPDIDLKPQSEHTTPWHFLDVWEGTKVFAITGHTHALGTNVEVKWAADKDDPGEDIYPLDQPFLWSESPVINYDPPLEFDDGEGFKYRCTWNNTTDKQVGFGESANKEMCFFWAYYYPSKGYRMCINTGSYADRYPVGESVCCPDFGALCSLIPTFIN